MTIDQKDCVLDQHKKEKPYRKDGKMLRFTSNQIEDLKFDADIMGYRLVYIPKPLDDNYFVLYYKNPQLTYIGHYSKINKLKEAMQTHYVAK